MTQVIFKKDSNWYGIFVLTLKIMQDLIQLFFSSLSNDDSVPIFGWLHVQMPQMDFHILKIK